MKVDFYVDVYEGSNPKSLTACTAPFLKSKNARRYKITTDIPDYAFTGIIDGGLPATGVVEVDKD